MRYICSLLNCNYYFISGKNIIEPSQNIGYWSVIYWVGMDGKNIIRLGKKKSFWNFFFSLDTKIIIYDKKYLILILLYLNWGINKYGYVKSINKRMHFWIQQICMLAMEEKILAVRLILLRLFKWIPLIEDVQLECNWWCD